DVKDRIADALCGAARDLLVAQHPQAKRVDQRIAFVTWVEIDLAGDRRDAETVAVMGDAAYDASEEPAVVVDCRFSICDFRLDVAIALRRLSATLSGRARVGVRLAVIGNRPEAQRVQRADGPGAHCENVANDPANARGRALKRLDCAGMIVRLDLERNGQAVADVDDAGIFLARADEDALRLGGKGFEERAGAFVGAMLAP